MAGAPQIAWPVGLVRLAHAAPPQWFAVVTGDRGSGTSTALWQLARFDREMLEEVLFLLSQAMNAASPLA